MRLTLQDADASHPPAERRTLKLQLDAPLKSKLQALLENLDDRKLWSLDLILGGISTIPVINV